ncbi:hypothetical protein FRB90_011954 [Tulasnella sp. 427]|nr:hypothetical protein FRB90_011954 [Tulasnella sp. 427]
MFSPITWQLLAKIVVFIINLILDEDSSPDSSSSSDSAPASPPAWLSLYISIITLLVLIFMWAGKSQRGASDDSGSPQALLDALAAEYKKKFDLQLALISSQASVAELEAKLKAEKIRNDELVHCFTSTRGQLLTPPQSPTPTRAPAPSTRPHLSRRVTSECIKIEHN